MATVKYFLQRGPSGPIGEEVKFWLFCARVCHLAPIQGLFQRAVALLQSKVSLHLFQAPQTSEDHEPNPLAPHPRCPGIIQQRPEHWHPAASSLDALL